MVVIGLKIGEGLKLVDVDVVGLKILDHWFEFSFESLGFKSRIVVGICCGYMFSWVYVFKLRIVVGICFLGFQIADSC